MVHRGASWVAALLLATACAGPRVPPAALATCRDAAVQASALRDQVGLLSTRFQPRDFDHPENLDRAAAFIGDALRATGAAVSEQT